MAGHPSRAAADLTRLAMQCNVSHRYLCTLLDIDTNEWMTLDTIVVEISDGKDIALNAFLWRDTQCVRGTEVYAELHDSRFPK